MKDLQKKIFWLNFVVVLFVAINLRAPITAIGPMVDFIKDFFKIDSADVGILSSIPLIAFGVISFLAIYLHPIKGMLIGIVCIILGEICRSYLGYFQDNLMLIGLFGGTLLMGSGIAIANVLLPSFIRAKFANKVPMMMGVYSVVMSISAIFGVVFTLPLLQYFSVPNVMAFWVFFALMALVAYMPQMQNNRLMRSKKQNGNIFEFFVNLDAWKVTIFMGLQSLISYSIFTWYPKMIVEKGFDITFGASMTFYMQLVSIPSALLTPLLISRIRNQYKFILLLCLCGCYVIGFWFLLFCDSGRVILWISLFWGIPVGGAFSLALFLISYKTNSIASAAKLSAMTQGFGYLIASFGPYIVGKLHDGFGGFDSGIYFLMIVAILLNISGILGLLAKKI
ncbi:MFS transporter [Helicobacter anseris]|uniref:MFS transporter n=1 Tax=Helicobacter anseris TaxID=375926 RepID=A0A3D8JBC9_9HELI|nr:MFS transporter [Helicobacter anseris]